MKRKIKLKFKRKANKNPEKGSGLTEYSQFSLACRETPNKEVGIIKEWWKKVYGNNPPWNERSTGLIKLKLVYELLRRDYKAANIPPPPKVQQNIEASRDFNIDNLTDGMKNLVVIGLRHEQRKEEKKQLTRENGEEKMAKKTKVVKKEKVVKEKVAKETVAGTIMRVLAENETKKVSDAKLAVLINKAHPGKKQNEAKDIKTYRSKYNSGRNWGMTAKPKVLSVCYDAPVKVSKTKRITKNIKKAAVALAIIENPSILKKRKAKKVAPAVEAPVEKKKKVTLKKKAA